MKKSLAWGQRNLVKRRPFAGYVLGVGLGCGFLMATGSARADYLPTVTPEVPNEVRKQILDDLEHLKNMRGGKTTDLHRQVFGGSVNLDGGEYARFFSRHVSRIDIHPSRRDFFVTAGGAENPMTLFVSPEYVKHRKSLPAFERLAILIHEARHNESDHGYWPHVLCPDPFLGLEGKPITAPWGQGLAGKPACDSEPLGSYGITYVMARNISRACSNCSSQEKREAASYADNIILRINGSAARDELKRDH